MRMIRTKESDPRESARGLSEEELRRIGELLGREPNETELALFSAMWSEHCSYKSSKVHLKRLPTAGERVVQGPGENAGAVDIGEGWCAVFKIESHNHPSFIEPYQGAATGVGGILRDIFTMGARPVALLNSLRFGPLERAKNRHLFSRVVAGIADYGNCVGVPTVGGEVYFNEIYSNNPLVNVFCLGLVRSDKIVRARATGPGNPVIYVGSKTGRDGIHGATMASAALTGAEGSSAERRSTVQVGDPFTEKLLLEACLEGMEKGLFLAVQDMGAAGLTSSASEMAAKGGVGIELDLSKVPTREPGMVPWEIMLSESQERMLIVVERGRETEVEALFCKWDLPVATIGRVTDDGALTIRFGAESVGRIPVSALTDDAPVYERPIAIPKFHETIQSFSSEALPIPLDLNGALKQLLASPTIASKEWVFSQYDHMVRTNTVVEPGSDAAVVRVRETGAHLAMTVDGNGLYTLLNPYYGGAIAVTEAARNVACAGARPIAMTDGLNFGDPQRPETMWYFALAVEGITDAATHLSIPVISGNVSFYNETKGLSIYPTVIIGMVGLIEPLNSGRGPLSSAFRERGDLIVLLGETQEELGATEYLRTIHSQERGFPPVVHLEAEASLIETLLEAFSSGLLRSAHDCSEGGIAITLSESAITGRIGARVDLAGGMRPDAVLFSETQGRVVVSLSPEQRAALEAIAARRGVPCRVIGEVGGEDLVISIEGVEMVEISVAEAAQIYREAIPGLVGA